MCLLTLLRPLGLCWLFFVVVAFVLMGKYQNLILQPQLLLSVFPVRNLV